MSGAPAPRAIERPPLINRILKDCFTDATGQGYSIARIVGAIIALIFILVIPAFIVFWQALGFGGPKPTITEWRELLGALQTYIPAIALAVAGFIGIAGATDPGGAWWSRSNAPPSQNTRTVDPPGAAITDTHTPGPPAGDERG